MLLRPINAADITGVALAEKNNQPNRKSIIQSLDREDIIICKPAGPLYPGLKINGEACQIFLCPPDPLGFLLRSNYVDRGLCALYTRRRCIAARNICNIPHLWERKLSLLSLLSHSR